MPQPSRPEPELVWKEFVFEDVAIKATHTGAAGGRGPLRGAGSPYKRGAWRGHRADESTQRPKGCLGTEAGLPRDPQCHPEPRSQARKARLSQSGGVRGLAAGSGSMLADPAPPAPSSLHSSHLCPPGSREPRWLSQSHSKVDSLFSRLFYKRRTVRSPALGDLAAGDPGWVLGCSDCPGGGGGGTLFPRMRCPSLPSLSRG